jgi:UDP-N-acetylglucosamine diphosphorylase / glucose-1-phosphate thymidylyltransferase / UDP-N-acetylgalactosamine diphosphorylase / glucosamine-1-phosphate N-acetyltransferase / galactosamine-1-phosphate N-acetyltransferase
MQVKQAVILAGGESSRFWPLNYKNKSLIKIMGKPLIWYAVDSLRKAGIKDIIVVQGPKKEIEEELKNYNLQIRYVVQQESKGMGDAVFQAKEILEDYFIIADVTRFDAGDFVDLLVKKQKKSGADIVLLGTTTQNPQKYGILDLEGDRAKNIIEKPETGKEPSKIRIVGVYLLPKSFMDYYEKEPIICMLLKTRFLIA